jgi:hypothetical protein
MILRCPECGRFTKAHADHTLKMHAKRGGGLCDGTGMQFLSATGDLCVAPGVFIPVRNIWGDLAHGELSYDRGHR